VLVIALVLDGSRIWSIGLVISTLVALIISDLKTWQKACGLGAVVITVALLIAESELVINWLVEHSPTNRIAAAIAAVSEQDTRSSGLGTLRFRRELDRRVVNRVENGSSLELVLGHGTCNITAIGFRTKDPNRFFHNEWFRVIYEWGVVGLLLWIIVFVSLAVYAVSGVRRDPFGYAKPLMSYLPAFVICLAGENFIAGAGACVDIGLLLLIGFAGVSHRQLRGRLNEVRYDPAFLESGTPVGSPA
jgi:hypothetical protein